MASARRRSKEEIGRVARWPVTSGSYPALDGTRPVDEPQCSRCFACGGEMPPWWFHADTMDGMSPVPHSDDPPRQWHPLCFEHWTAYLLGWRIYGAGTIEIIGPPVSGYHGKRIVSRALYFANPRML